MSEPLLADEQVEDLKEEDIPWLFGHSCWVVLGEVSAGEDGSSKRAIG